MQHYTYCPRFSCILQHLCLLHLLLLFIITTLCGPKYDLFIYFYSHTCYLLIANFFPPKACELHIAGYRFSVVSNAFVVHKGFKVQGEFHSRKDEENRKNRLLFRSFKESLKAKYPHSPRRC